MTVEIDPSLEEAPAPRSSVPPGLRPGLVVAAKYELVRKLGTGAMGEVWAARHLSLGEEVAIKLVVRNVGHEDGTSSDGRFLLEARVAASLSRKTRHIVTVTDHGEDGPHAYLVMELLPGEALDARLARTGPMPLKKAVPLITQIARGLAVAHAEGVVHRDLKPSNVFVTVDEDGRALVKILDFGIAKLRPSIAKRAAHDTLRGFLLGTPAFMSPEQARGKVVDHRTDVWALAVMAYHLLTGEFPFDGETAEDLFARLCRIEPIPIAERRPDLPPVVSDFFARAFSPALDDRFSSALALAGAFEQLEPLAGSAPSLPPPPSFLLEAERPRERALDATSIIAAGVPRRGRLGVRLAAGALVGAALAGAFALLFIHVQGDPAPPATGLAASLSRAPAAREVTVPPPAEVKAPAVAQPAADEAPAEVDEAPVEAPVRRARSMKIASSPAPAPPPDTGAPPAPEPGAASAPDPAPRPAHDRSEIF